MELELEVGLGLELGLGLEALVRTWSGCWSVRDMKRSGSPKIASTVTLLS